MSARTRRAAGVAAALGFAPLLGGCALSAGDSFAEVSATLEARLAPAPDRDLGGGWQRLNTDFAVRFARAELTLERVELQDLGAGGESLGFDPASPPPGYGLCHNGHCHRDDGVLVSYEDIAAELAGGGASAARTLVALPVGPTDLLAPAPRALPCDPSCGLPRAHLGRARLTPARLVLEGAARDEREPARFPGEVPFTLDLLLLADGTGVLHLDVPLDAPADRDAPPGIDLALTLTTTARLLDGVPLDALGAAAGLIDLDAPAGEAARNEIRLNLAESELSAEVTRHDDL